MPKHCGVPNHSYPVLGYPGSARDALRMRLVEDQMRMGWDHPRL
jgi:hypothetical protein